MNRCRQKSREGGFSLLEVLLAILAVTLFLMGTLQLTVIAAWYKLLSKQQANANLWIQSDIEEIQALAASLPPDVALCRPVTLTTPPYTSTNLPNSYAGMLQYQIENSTTLPGSTTKSLLGSSSDKLYQMTRIYGNITTNNSNALEINYTVKESISQPNPSNSTVAQGKVVVIPPAAFQCP